MENEYCIRTCIPDEEGRFLYLRDFSGDLDDEWTFWGSDDEPLFFAAADVDRAVSLITMNCIERGEEPYRLVILERNQALATTWTAVPTSTLN
jgi:hypothetical protein